MKKELHFERAEFASRLGAVKKEMANGGLDILLLSEIANQNYLTGYNAYSFYTPQMMIVALNRDEPIWIGRGKDSVSAKMTTYLADENIRGYPDQYVAPATVSAYDFMADIVKEIGGERAKIGVEMKSFYYSAGAHAEFVRALPFADFVDADLLVDWIRIVLSPAEIAIMRQAGQIADVMIQRAVDVIAPGVRECDVAAAVYHQQISGTPNFGGSYAVSPPFLCVGDHAIAPHADWTDDPLPASTILNLELFANRHHYQINLARSVSIGKPSSHYQKISEVLVEAVRAGLESVRPGQTCEQVDQAFRGSLSHNGIEKVGRSGYPIGLGFPPSLQLRTASLCKGDKTVLQPGMCFHLMAGHWTDEFGIAITQPFAVSENGHEPLTSVPRKLFVK